MADLRRKIVGRVIRIGRELFDKVKNLVESDELANINDLIKDAEKELKDNPSHAYSLVDRAIVALGNLINQEDARIAVSQSHDVIDYKKLIRERDLALDSLLEGYKRDGGDMPIERVAKAAKESLGIKKEAGINMIRELWGFPDAPKISLTFAVFSPDPVSKTVESIPPGNLLECSIKNTKLFTYDIRSLFDRVLIGAKYPTKTTESINPSVIERYQRLSQPLAECTEDKPLLDALDVGENFYKVGDSIYKIEPRTGPYEYYIDQANKQVNKVIQDEILKFYYRVQPPKIRGLRNDNVKYIHEIANGTRASKTGRGLLASLGAVLCKNNYKVAPQVLVFYKSIMGHEKDRPDQIDRLLRTPKIIRRLNDVTTIKEDAPDNKGSIFQIRGGGVDLIIRGDPKLDQSSAIFERVETVTTNGETLTSAEYQGPNPRRFVESLLESARGRIEIKVPLSSLPEMKDLIHHPEPSLDNPPDLVADLPN
jgi:hypothetical protein